MTAYHTYFLTSLDLHLVELEDFKYGGTNITAFRLVNPGQHGVQASKHSISILLINSLFNYQLPNLSTIIITKFKCKFSQEVVDDWERVEKRFGRKTAYTGRGNSLRVWMVRF